MVCIFHNDKDTVHFKAHINCTKTKFREEMVCDGKNDHIDMDNQKCRKSTCRLQDTLQKSTV